MTLRELLERERDRAAEEPMLTASGRGRMTFKNGADHFIALLMPVVRIASELPDAEHGELREALAELEAKLGKGEGEG